MRAPRPGRFDAATVYGDDPAAVAAEFCAQPIRRLHVVDLDGAREGSPRNSDVIGDIVRRAGSVPVQLGGGLRSLEAARRAFDLGVDRIVLGTAALRDPDLVAAVAAEQPGRVAVGIDARGGQVAVEGWVEATDARAVDVARRLEDSGASAIIYTEIARDGMLSGPDLEATAALAGEIAIPVIASGGIGSPEDVQRAASYAARGVTGVIVGRALYTGAVDLAATLELLACS